MSREIKKMGLSISPIGGTNETQDKPAELVSTIYFGSNVGTNVSIEEGISGKELSIVLDADTYTYMKLGQHDTGGVEQPYNSYFYASDVIRLNDNQYRYTFTMDIWTTYGRHVVNNESLGVTRSNGTDESNPNIFPKEHLIYDDPLLNTLPKSVERTQIGLVDETVNNPTVSFPYTHYSLYNNKGLIAEPNALGFKNSTTYFVFAGDITRPNYTDETGVYTLIPVLNESIEEYDNYSVVKNPHGQDINCSNDFGTIQQYAINSDYGSQSSRPNPDGLPNPNQFIGVYSLPNLKRLTDADPTNRGDTIERARGAAGTDRKTFFCFKLPHHKIVLPPNYINFTLKPRPTKYDDENLTLQCLQYMELTYNGKSIPGQFFGSSLSNYIQLYENFYFNRVGILGSNDNWYLKPNETIIELPTELPSYTDQFVKQYQGIQSQVNTGIEVENSRNNLSIAQNLFGGAAGIASAAMTKNALGALNSAGSTAFGLVSNQIQHENYFKQLSARHADMKRVSSMDIATSTSKAMVTAALSEDGVRGRFGGEVYNYKVLTTDTIKLINNGVYLNGVICPRVINNVLRIPQDRKFNFFQVSEEGLNMHEPKLLKKVKRKDIGNEIRSILNGGVRLGRETPTY